MPALLLLLLLSVSNAPDSSPKEGKTTVRQIQMRGNSRVLALDVPVRRGRLYLFHRYPDGVYMSVPAEDVLGIAATTVEPPAKLPETVVLGPTGEGLPADAAGPAAATPQTYYDMGYPGYYGYGYWPCFGCGGNPRPPHPSPNPPPSIVGPNGFPLLPGSPQPLPIGPNGFPILSPSTPPPVASPR